MHQNCVLMSALLMIADGFIVHGPSGPLVAPLGSSVVLPCYVDEPLLTEDLEVEWRRTDPETLVHLYQDGESRPEAQLQDYQDRAHFFTEHIKDGNFSLRLDNLRAEDEGEYTCTVHSQRESGETEVQIKDVERLLVSGSDRPISASVGEDVTLNCSVDSHITPEEVSWTKTNEEKEILVLLYQNNDAFPDSSDERFRDRVEFFTDEIPKGNFSVRLKSVRTEDKGVYMCQVFAGGASANATVVLERLGFSALHIIMLILCFSASGSALLLCCLIYCRSTTKGLIVQKSCSLFVHLGRSVILPCHVPPHLLTEDLKVEWRNKDLKDLVHLYEDGKSRSDEQHKDYQDRAHFFTEHIKNGNFSLRLDNLRAEDEGEYTCTVHSKRDCVFSAKTNLDLEFYVNGNYIPLGSSVVLPCQVNKRLLKKSLKVEWRRTHSETLVHLYEDGASRPEKQHQDYHKRAHFSNKKIKDGNFSLRLKNVRAGDKGVYRCEVYKDEHCVSSTKTELKLVFILEPSRHTPVPLGSSVVLPCYDERSSGMEDLKVEWRRTDPETDDSETDSQTLVHLYQDGESRPEVQLQDYQNRANFFTEHIKDGNFSLRLDNLRAEDEGEYTCTVRSQRESGETEVQIKDVERLLVLGSDRPISASVGEDVTLNCSVDSHITPEDFEQVSWKKNNEEEEILVLLYQDHEAFPDSSDERFRDRVEFFTDEIPKGNFSVRLKSVRAEDKGVYMCQVFAGGASASATVVLERLGFSALHIIMLILCVSASGSALLLCCLIYCRSTTDAVFRLQMCLVFCPNILMFLAFVLWGVSEGSVFESVSCCALYSLRPLVLLWAAPYINHFTGKIKTWIENDSYETEYIVFSAVFYSVLFKSAWDKSLNYGGFEGVMIIVLFVVVLLFILFYIIYTLATLIGKFSERIITIFRVLAGISFDVLPSLQFILLFFAFGSIRGGFIIVAVLPVILSVTNYNWNFTCGQQMGCSRSVVRSVWFMLMLLINAVMVYFYIIALENEKDRVGWACVIAFLQLLWAAINFTWSFEYDLLRVVPVYVFGSVGVVLLNAVALMTELILKTVNGEGAVGDLRVVVFSSEFLFTLFLMVLMVFKPWIEPCLQSCQKAIKSRRTPVAGSQDQESQNAAGSDETPAAGSNQNQSQSQSQSQNQTQNPAESHEMKPLLNQDQDAGKSETQLDSVVSQT